jgi:hypothetical protein
LAIGSERPWPPAVGLNSFACSAAVLGTSQSPKNKPFKTTNELFRTEKIIRRLINKSSGPWPIFLITNSNHLSRDRSRSRLTTREHRMPIRRYVDNASFDPEAIEILHAAYLAVCADLGLTDKTDPATRLVAKKVIQAATEARDRNKFARPCSPHSTRLARPGSCMRVVGTFGS